jgi:hypothetical protein
VHGSANGIVHALLSPRTGEWVTGAGGLGSFEGEVASLFKIYESTISQESPECLSALRRMLQAGPVGTAFARGRGFSLRMPEAELVRVKRTCDAARFHLSVVANSELRCVTTDSVESLSRIGVVLQPVVMCYHQRC